MLIHDDIYYNFTMFFDSRRGLDGKCNIFMCLFKYMAERCLFYRQVRKYFSTIEQKVLFRRGDKKAFTAFEFCRNQTKAIFKKNNQQQLFHV